jgi:hypothetical protein
MTICCLGFSEIAPARAQWVFTNGPYIGRYNINIDCFGVSRQVERPRSTEQELCAYLYYLQNTYSMKWFLSLTIAILAVFANGPPRRVTTQGNPTTCRARMLDLRASWWNKSMFCIAKILTKTGQTNSGKKHLRQGRLRAAPHFYNTDDEMRKLVVGLFE